MDKHTTEPSARPTTSDEVFGAPSWVSLMARDLNASQDFYGAVMGWEFRPGQLGEDFLLALDRGSPVAGLGALATALQVSVTWIPYFAVTDLDQTAARVRERSGTMAVGPLSFVLGRGALAADRDGAAFGLWEGQLLPEWVEWRDHAPAWAGLHTRDAFEAAIFYGEVLEWGTERPGACEVEYVDGEVVLRSDGHVVARLSSGALENAPDPLVRPHWVVHFRVPDVARCIAACHAHGGSVTEERTTPLGPEATLRDPDGGIFTVNEVIPPAGPS
ncbi:VOC family protein [Streptomyces sp. TS71-3]|uniref:VOC family protein n=1 Tax=Streptomyces sp. TS71-3 TaxID=2733862 RepID=UPI001BB37400|nr:VOC family protein [Streptomyces sp. TS71-3]